MEIFVKKMGWAAAVFAVCVIGFMGVQAYQEVTSVNFGQRPQSTVYMAGVVPVATPFIYNGVDVGDGSGQSMDCIEEPECLADLEFYGEDLDVSPHGEDGEVVPTEPSAVNAAVVEAFFSG